MYMEMFEEAYENYTKEYGNDFNRCIANPDIYKGLKEECNIPIHNTNLIIKDIKIDYGLGIELFYFYKHEESLLTYTNASVTIRPLESDNARIDLNGDIYFNVNRQDSPERSFISGGSISSDIIRANSISSSRLSSSVPPSYFVGGINPRQITDEIDFTPYND